MDTTASIEDLARMNDVLKAFAKEEAPSKDGPTTSKIKRIPAIEVFHLQYDNQGRVIDWHLDHWRVDANSLIKKLNRRDNYGRAIWALTLPEGTTKPDATLPCRVPTCMAGPFRTAADIETHMQGHHRMFLEMERKQKEADDRNQMNKILETLAALMADKQSNKKG
jgi:hypothetical protein